MFNIESELLEKFFNKFTADSEFTTDLHKILLFPLSGDMPRNFNESAWFTGDAWNIFFKIQNNKRYTLQSSVLR